MDYVPDKDVIARRIARIFRSGDVVNLGIGLPTLVVNHLPAGVSIILQSENGLMGLGPAPPPGQEDRDMVNAGGAPITVQPGGCFFDSAASFGIIRGGHVDYTVLGVLEVDQEGNLANYKVPGKMVPGMGGAMDLTTGARKVIAATLHFEPTGASRLRRRCSLPLTAAREVDLVVTDLGLFEVRDGRFLLRECLGPYPPDWIRERTDADIDVADGAWPA
ncbi:3-oxoacid CoA-transferase subunit B [Geothrix sp. 21YS21S-2]|uniref:3-oxoacid CoA-transferase subunit B n=1 Tax=Geothrix sp. 21YS21S-2 TaxID=3068893 RepID=UPI0027BA2C14|nr:3-oxoacid CoA-transferase subunit B [Geothrix sp. 21YS21S-2]